MFVKREQAQPVGPLPPDTFCVGEPPSGVGGGIRVAPRASRPYKDKRLFFLYMLNG